MADPTLADVIRQLREELAAAAAEADREGAAFSVETAEVELTFVVRDTLTEGGGLKLGFPGFGIDLQANQSGGRDLTHKLKVLLKPIDSYRVANRKFYDPTGGEAAG